MPITGVGAGAAAAGGLEYVDRGDPAAWDKQTADFTIDGAWHDLNLAAIVSDADAVLVKLRFQMKDAATGRYFWIREDGNANAINILGGDTTVANQYMYFDGDVPLSATRTVEYLITTGTDAAYLTVRGWWKPAS